MIAERTWTYSEKDGTETDVPVRFKQPYQKDDGYWRAEFEIYWPGGNVILRYALGVDAVDALSSVLELFKIECTHLQRSEAGEHLRFSGTRSLSFDAAELRRMDGPTDSAGEK